MISKHHAFAIGGFLYFRKSMFSASAKSADCVLSSSAAKIASCLFTIGSKYTDTDFLPALDGAIFSLFDLRGFGGVFFESPITSCNSDSPLEKSGKVANWVLS